MNAITLALLAALAQQAPQPPLPCPGGQCFNQLPAAPVHRFPFETSIGNVVPPAPNRNAAVAQPAPPSKGWHEGVFDGQRRKVWGWIDANGWLNYFDAENPQLKPTAPAPKPAPTIKAAEAEKPAKPPEGPVATALPGVLLESNGQLDAGLDVASLKPRENQLDTNDAEFAEAFYAEPPEEGGKPKPDPGPTPSPSPRTSGIPTMGAGGLLLAAAALLLISLPR